MLQTLLALLTFLSALPLFPGQPGPDPALIQPFYPGSAAAAASSATPSTIPAFPEQSDVAGCPLDLPDDLFTGIRRACSSTGDGPVSRGRCCPTLAAWLYSAHSASALRHSAASTSSQYDLPVLPDDSESCVYAAEKALNARGVEMRAPNGTCDVVYCYCGVRLRPLSCPEAFRVGADGKWAEDDKVRRIERDCSARSGGAGCSRCLRSLYKLSGTQRNNRSANNDRKGEVRSRECEAMGVTWLLAKNRTAYMPTLTSVLRVLMLSPLDSHPRSCGLRRDGMPLAVDSDFLSDTSSSTVGCGFTATVVVAWICCVVFLILTRV